MKVILSVPDEGYSNLLILSVPDEGYSRNVSCTLTLISSFLLERKGNMLHDTPL
jgi:hypothetical protein